MGRATNAIAGHERTSFIHVRYLTREAAQCPAGVLANTPSEKTCAPMFSSSAQGHRVDLKKGTPKGRGAAGLANAQTCPPVCIRPDQPFAPDLTSTLRGHDRQRTTHSSHSRQAQLGLKRRTKHASGYRLMKVSRILLTRCLLCRAAPLLAYCLFVFRGGGLAGKNGKPDLARLSRGHEKYYRLARFGRAIASMRSKPTECVTQSIATDSPPSTHCYLRE